MTQTTIYRNDKSGYTVTLIDNGRGATVKDSLGYNFPMVGADYPHAARLAASRAHFAGAIEVATPEPAQIVSPLAADAQVRSDRPLAAGVIGLPSLPQARCLTRELVTRGYASVTGQTAPMPVLIAMARRGWLDLDHPIRPGHGHVNAAGKRALAAYVAKHGPVQ